MNIRRKHNSIYHAPALEHDRSQKGTALVEFAFVLPIFMLILFGIVTFSIALYNQTILTLAVREGARSGVLFYPSHTDDEIISDAKAAAWQVCQDKLITFGSNSMTEDDISTNDEPLGDKFLTVTARFSYTGIFIIPKDLELSASTTMEME